MCKTIYFMFRVYERFVGVRGAERRADETPPFWALSCYSGTAMVEMSERTRTFAARVVGAARLYPKHVWITGQISCVCGGLSTLGLC